MKTSQFISWGQYYSDPIAEKDVKEKYILSFLGMEM